MLARAAITHLRGDEGGSFVESAPRPSVRRTRLERRPALHLLKDAPSAELATAIRRVMAGERVVDPSLAVGEEKGWLTLRSAHYRAVVACIANASGVPEQKFALSLRR